MTEFRYPQNVVNHAPPTHRPSATENVALHTHALACVMFEPRTPKKIVSASVSFTGAVSQWYRCIPLFFSPHEYMPMPGFSVWSGPGISFLQVGLDDKRSDMRYRIVFPIQGVLQFVSKVKPFIICIILCEMCDAMIPSAENTSKALTCVRMSSMQT